MLFPATNLHFWRIFHGYVSHNQMVTCFNPRAGIVQEFWKTSLWRCSRSSIWRRNSWRTYFGSTLAGYCLTPQGVERIRGSTFSSALRTQIRMAEVGGTQICWLSSILVSNFRQFICNLFHAILWVQLKLSTFANRHDPFLSTARSFLLEATAGSSWNAVRTSDLANMDITRPKGLMAT